MNTLNYSSLSSTSYPQKYTSVHKKNGHIEINLKFNIKKINHGLVYTLQHVCGDFSTVENVLQLTAFCMCMALLKGLNDQLQIRSIINLLQIGNLMYGA